MSGPGVTKLAVSREQREAQVRRGAELSKRYIRVLFTREDSGSDQIVGVFLRASEVKHDAEHGLYSAIEDGRVVGQFPDTACWLRWDNQAGETDLNDLSAYEEAQAKKRFPKGEVDGE